jgi:hypothetical protein
MPVPDRAEGTGGGEGLEGPRRGVAPVDVTRKCPGDPTHRFPALGLLSGATRPDLALPFLLTFIRTGPPFFVAMFAISRSAFTVKFDLFDGTYLPIGEPVLTIFFCEKVARRLHSFSEHLMEPNEIGVPPYFCMGLQFHQDVVAVPFHLHDIAWRDCCRDGTHCRPESRFLFRAHQSADAQRR